MEEKKTEMFCLKFREKEPIIKDLTNKINKAKDIREKVKYAEMLKKEVDEILSCEDYDEENLECQSFRLIAKLRKKTAELIIKAKKLVK